MNVLLLLLAMLSALTGVGAAVRAPVPAQAAAVAAEPRAAVVAAVAGRLPERDCRAKIVRVASTVESVAFMLPAFTPLFASRRRE